ncbi:zf-HC2 domain-containing protein [Streptomyces sp. TRM 70361]|uniref:zf-HC2 domain-containing protein n=1 Tax=Streptomyces sp. TRM 70361 TaxID=3116553 RepID=UPI002E7AB1F8|nr:zf-HC2 domain-containing protein [Streptomyces sp. TRM 70361]MEE1938362.1 zf-HC2 domain-containing protein [Streptomyces sp. TRM 70361]
MSRPTGRPPGGDGAEGPGAGRPRIPAPRPPADDLPAPGGGTPDGPGGSDDHDHPTLGSLLGAWALAVCSPEEAAAVEAHLPHCPPCADEARRLRDAVGLIRREDALDPGPELRSGTMEECLRRRPAAVPLPRWAAPYDAETARLDALLRDMGDTEWDTPVRLRWTGGERVLTLCGVLAHLGCADGLVAVRLGLADPLGPGAPRTVADRTEAAIEHCLRHEAPFVRDRWRAQTRSIVRTAAREAAAVADLPVDFAEFRRPVRDALVGRAFACWIHADDIAAAVDYPYEPPAPGHLAGMVELAVRRVPAALADRRRAGLAAPARSLTAAGTPGRTLLLEIEGRGGGEWYLPLDSPAALATPERTVARLVLEDVEFCRLAAGHVPPRDAAAGQEGDREATGDTLRAVASLSRL